MVSYSMVPDVMLPKCEKWAYLFILAHSLQQVRIRVGGSINDRISCGGVAVSPGDIILGDDDGVTVVPLAQADEVLDASLKRMANEADILNKLATGEDASGSFPNPELEFMS